MPAIDEWLLPELGTYRPMKRTEFERLAQLGYFEEERVELLFGLVIPMVPPKSEHDNSVVRVQHALFKQVGDRREGTWRDVSIHHLGETIAMLAFPDVTIAVAEILPPEQ